MTTSETRTGKNPRRAKAEICLYMEELAVKLRRYSIPADVNHSVHPEICDEAVGFLERFIEWSQSICIDPANEKGIKRELTRGQKQTILGLQYLIARMDDTRITARVNRPFHPEICDEAATVIENIISAFEALPNKSK